MTDIAPTSSFATTLPQDLISKWQTQYLSAKMDRLSFEREWHMNMAFYLGRQWSNWSTSELTPAARLVEPLKDKKRVRLTVNICRLMIRKELAKLNKERIRGYVASASSDDDDLAASRAGEKLAEYLQYKARVARVMARCDFWTAVFGTGFLKHTYNPTIMGPDGPVPQVNPMTGFPVVDPSTGQPVMGRAPLYGMPDLEAVSPFNVLIPNIDEEDIEKQDWVMHCIVMTRKQIMDLYEVDIPDEGIIANNTADSRLQEAYGWSRTNSRRGIEVKEVWVKPCPEYPDGMRLVWAGDKVLALDESWPYEHKQYPFSRRIHIQSGRFYGTSTLVDLIPLQIEYNQSRSQVIENRNATAKPTFLAQKGSFDVRKLSGSPGQVIEYRAGTQPPTAMQIPQVPGYVFQSIGDTKQEMAELTAQGESQVPQGVEAAAAISYLMENQDSVLQDTLRDKEDVFQRVISQFLSYVIQYWDSARIVKIVGDNTNFEAFTLKGSDLRSNTDYRVEVGSATPVSRSAKQAQITELIKLKAIPPEKGLQHLELGDTAKLFEDMQIDARQAERQNLKMSKGEPCAVNPWDDHIIHIREHDNYRKREEFENKPEIHAIFGNHVCHHLYLLAQSFGIDQSLGPAKQVFDQLKQNPEFYDPSIEEMLRNFVMSMQQASAVPESGAPVG